MKYWMECFFSNLRNKRTSWFISVTRSRKVVWKHGANGPFYELFWEPSYTRIHSPLPCSKIWTNKKAGLLRLFVISHFTSYWINIRVSSFLCQDTNMPESNFVKKSCNLSKKQISTVSNKERRVKLIHHNFFFTILLGASYTKRAIKYYRAD